MQPATLQPHNRISLSIGHATNAAAATGCTVFLFDQSAATVVDVRGGAPGTRETDLLQHGALVQRSDAILFSGGSAFGLAAADGVMRWLADAGRGVRTGAGPIPIVPAAVIYDLGVGEAVSPNADDGRAACEAARPLTDALSGQIGAGTGATTGKANGIADAAPGGFGIAFTDTPLGRITVGVVVNALGDVVDPATGRPVWRKDLPLDRRQELVSAGLPAMRPGEATTLAVIAIDAPVDRSTLVRCNIAAHDAFARAIRPCHTIFDGDVSFAVALQEGSPSPMETLSFAVATELAVEQAILRAVRA